MASQYEMQRQAEGAAREIFAHLGTDDEAGDAVHDRADDLVPSMTADIIKEWSVIPEFDSENYSGEYNIIDQMRAVLYEWYESEIREYLESLQEEAEEVDEEFGSECNCSNPYCQA